MDGEETALEKELDEWKLETFGVVRPPVSKEDWEAFNKRFPQLAIPGLMERFKKAARS
jgi:hypothetical protein